MSAARGGESKRRTETNEIEDDGSVVVGCAGGVVPETGDVEDEDEGEVESERVGIVGAGPAVGLGGDAGEEGQQGWSEEEGEGVQLVQQRVERPDEVLTAVHARSTSTASGPSDGLHVPARSSARHGPGRRPATQATRRVCSPPSLRAHSRLCLCRRNDRPLQPRWPSRVPPAHRRHIPYSCQCPLHPQNEVAPHQTRPQGGGSPRPQRRPLGQGPCHPTSVLILCPCRVLTLLLDMTEQEIADSEDYYEQLSLYVMQGTTRAALLSCGGVVEACLAVARGELQKAFAIVRPPGHHAEPDEHMGFCLLNNVAVAAKVVQQLTPIKRIMILDWWVSLLVFNVLALNPSI